MRNSLLSQNTYLALFGLLGIVYIIGLFVPLMDNDSAHHAVIALHMHLTGDYVNLIDAGVPYLDKPHLHFWMAAWSYKIFGVTTFAYKFPSFLFTLAGTYATYRLGTILYSKEAGKLAALIVSSALAYMLANMDVRMDAILTATVALSSWQLVAWIQNKKAIHALGVALALALGFSTKGHIAVVTPAAGAFFYVLFTKNWRSFYHPQLLLIIAGFFVFIAPVVYCYYLQYDLHPELVVRGRNQISGVKFILWQQNTERLQGDSFGSDAKNDYFFFFHSFLWAFAPWSVLAFTAIFNKIKNIRSSEWFTLGSIGFIALVLTFSGFKLPHYLNIIFPAAAVLTAGFIEQLRAANKPTRPYTIMQTVICILLLLAVAVLNVWTFPVNQIWITAGVLVLASMAYWLYRNEAGKWSRIVMGSVLTAACVWFLLNSNFYPQLLTYQAGNELAKKIPADADKANLFQQPGLRSFSFDFYTQRLAEPLPDGWIEQGNTAVVLANPDGITELRNKYRLGTITRHRDFSVTQLTGKFINPATRRQALEELALVEVLGMRQN